MDQALLYVWVAIMVVLIVTAPAIRKVRGKKLPESQDFVVVGFALGTALALVKLLFEVLTQESLQAELNWDGTVALCISSSLGIYMSVKSIAQLF